MYLLPANVPPSPGDCVPHKPAAGAPAAAELAAGHPLPPLPPLPPVHPDATYFSFPILLGRVLILKQRGQLERALALESAIERALNIKIQWDGVIP